MSSTYKKETSYTTSATLGNGEVIDLEVTQKRSGEIYYVKKLNSGVCIMDLAEAMEEICKSSRDIKIFFTIIDSADKAGSLTLNISKLSEILVIDKNAIERLVKRMISFNTLYKHKAGIYTVNPYIVTTTLDKRAQEQSQMDWNILHIDSLDTNEQLRELVEGLHIDIDFDLSLVKLGSKSTVFIKSLLVGFKEYGKLTKKQHKVIVEMLIKHRQKIAASRFKALTTTKYNLLTLDEMSDEQVITFKSLHGAKRLEYWQSISTKERLDGKD